jgi:hypothetical protein
MNKGIGGHHSPRMKNDEWLTPPELIKKLGTFDLDPCAPIYRPWDTAKFHYTIIEDGLSKEWFGRVWLNPPYGKETGKWLNKLVKHGNGIALVFARTETEMFFDYIWSRADGLLFLKGRLYFYHVNGEKAKSNSGAPSVLVAYGQNNVNALKRVSDLGQLVLLKNQ